MPKTYLIVLLCTLLLTGGTPPAYTEDGALPRLKMESPSTIAPLLRRLEEIPLRGGPGLPAYEYLMPIRRPAPDFHSEMPIIPPGPDFHSEMPIIGMRPDRPIIRYHRTSPDTFLHDTTLVVPSLKRFKIIPD